MKLYRVEVTKVLYIVAEDEDELRLDAARYAREDDNDPSVDITEATPDSIKEDGWEGSLVYGNHGEDYPAEEAVKLNVQKG